MRYNKKIILLMLCVSILLCILTMQETYAKYSTSNNATSNMSIARWRILVNNFDIRNDLSASTVIQPVFSGNNNISDGYIAPTANGYFDILIDATETDVSFNYQISLNQNSDNEVIDLAITGYSINNGATQTYNNNITGSINKNDVNKTMQIRVFVTWNDGEGSVMNNQDDTDTTGENATAKLDVNLNFIQQSN